MGRHRRPAVHSSHGHRTTSGSRRRLAGGGPTGLTVEYQFTDAAGNNRKDQATTPLDAQLPPPGGKLPIRYTPGADGSSRLAGQVNWFGPAFLAVSLAALVFVGAKLVREANDDTPRKRKR